MEGQRLEHLLQKNNHIVETPIIQTYMHIEEDSDEEQQQTIENLINQISFSSKKEKDSTNKSVSGSSINDSFFETKQKKERSKAWTEEQNKLFIDLIEHYGTDFTLIKEFFPKKSKNQIKKKYKSQAKTLNFKVLPFHQPIQNSQQKKDVANKPFFVNILGNKFSMINEEMELIQKQHPQ